MRITVVQMNPGAEKSANIVQAERLIGQAVREDHPEFLALPEMWTCLGGDRATKFREAEILPPPGTNGAGGEAYEFLRRMARSHRVYLHGGSLAELAGEKLFNTTVVFNPEGQEIARYRKLHLFDIVGPDGTGYRESNTYASGDTIVTCDVGGIRVGLAICYDLRFPELFFALRRAGAELIVLPSAFTLQTGKDHWEVLLRARAIETQCWFAAPATWGRHFERGEARYTFGHSLICDPWGMVVAQASDGVGWASARLDPARTERVRADMPMLAARPVFDRKLL